VVKFKSGKEPREPPNEADTTQEPVWTFRTAEKYFAPTEIVTPDRQLLAAVSVQTAPYLLTAIRRTKRKISAEYCFRHGMTIHDLLATWKLTVKSKGRFTHSMPCR